MYTLIGDGRVARHFSHYFDLLGISFRTWSRGADENASELGQALEGSSHALILIKDSAIEPFVRQHDELQGKTLVHFSGSLVCNLAVGVHPLMTFSEQLYCLEDYLEIPFVIERNRGTMHELLPGLENPYWYIESEQKAYYHTLCVLSGNFSCLLWGKALSEFEQRLDLPREIAFPYLRRICENLQREGARALTGPLVRGDQETIERNLAALEGDPFRSVYEGFLKTFENHVRGKDDYDD